MTKKIAMCVAAALLAGCSDLTKVDAPDLVQRPSLENANGAVTLFYGAVKQFYSAVTLSISGGASLSDEITDAATFAGSPDTRIIPDNIGSDWTGIRGSRIHQLQR